MGTVNAHFLICPAKILTEKDFKAVYKAVRGARTKWRQFGIEFDFTPQELDDLESQHPHDNDRCLQEVVMMWLKNRSIRPSWVSLIAVLRESTVGEEGIAVDIKEQYLTCAAGNQRSITGGESSS